MIFERPTPDMAPLRDVGGAGGGASPLPQDPQKAGVILQGKLDTLKEWANDNEAQAKRDRLYFWSFKLPAIICAASTSVLEAFGMGSIVIVLGAISAICVSIDAAYPLGQLYNVHRRAANDIFLLRSKIKNEWDKIILTFPDANSSELNKEVSAILNMIQIEIDRINNYLTSAETNLYIKKHNEN